MVHYEVMIFFLKTEGVNYQVDLSIPLVKCTEGLPDRRPVADCILPWQSAWGSPGKPPQTIRPWTCSWILVLGDWPRTRMEDLLWVPEEVNFEELVFEEGERRRNLEAKLITLISGQWMIDKEFDWFIKTESLTFVDERNILKQFEAITINC